MVARAKKARRAKANRRNGMLFGIPDEVASRAADVRKMVRKQYGRLEKQANDLQTMVRRRAAMRLREVARQIRRLEKAVAPPAKKPRAARRPARKRAKPVAPAAVEAHPAHKAEKVAAA
jgi:hypothetical protein